MRDERPRAPAGKPPRAGTIAQPRPAFGVILPRPPHAATVAQPRPAFGTTPPRPPHPAAVAQPKAPHAAWLGPRRASVQRAVLQTAEQPVPLIAPIPTGEFDEKNAFLLESYKAYYTTKVSQDLDCGLKIRGLIGQVATDLAKHAKTWTVDDMGLIVRFVLPKDAKGKIQLLDAADDEKKVRWTGAYHVYLRCEDTAGNDLLYDPYIGDADCRGTTAEDAFIAARWRPKAPGLERLSIAGVGTDLPISIFSDYYEGPVGDLVDHARALQKNPALATAEPELLKFGGW